VSLDLGPLSPSNVDQQFCSDWLKSEIRRLFNRAEMLELRLGAIADAYSHTYVGSTGIAAQIEGARADRLSLQLQQATDCMEASIATIKVYREVLKGLSDRHWGHPDMGMCICEWHIKAREMLQ
jgi:hypothetical protein